MKHSSNTASWTLFILCSLSLVTFMISCNQKNEKKDSISYEGKTNGDTLTQTPGSNTQPIQPPSGDTSTTTGSGTYTPPVVKKCDPSYKLLASPSKTQKIIYVSGFNAGEFKCWEELVKYSQLVCGNNSCLIYY